MPEGAPIDLERCEQLVASVLAGDGAAWKALMTALVPSLLVFAASTKPLGYRRADEDARHEVLTSVLERLRKNDFRALRTYPPWRSAPQNAGKTLADWLRIVMNRVASDYVSHRARRSVLNTLGVALDTGAPPSVQMPGMTDAQAVRELVEHADKCLPPEQAYVVRKVFEGRSAEDIASATGETKEDIEKRLRAAYARLRRWADYDREDGDAPSGD